MKWLMSVIIIFLNCYGGISKKTSTSSSSLLEDLESRAYKISYPGKDKTKEPYKLYTHEKTQILSGDLQKICSIKSIEGIEFGSSLLPETFPNEIEFCDFKIITFLRFEEMKVDPKMICNLSKKKNIEWLSFLDAYVTDNILECVGKIQSIDTFDLTGSNNTYTDEGFCKFAKSGIKIRSLNINEALLTKKGYDCLAEIQGIEGMGFKKWKNFSKQEMNAVKDLYFKKQGKKIVVETFEYDKL